MTILYCLCSSPQTLMSGSNPMLGPGLNLGGILPPGGLMPTMQSAAQTGKRFQCMYYCYLLWAVWSRVETTLQTSRTPRVLCIQPTDMSLSIIVNSSPQFQFVCTVLAGESNFYMCSRESFWPEQQRWVETTKPAAGMTLHWSVCVTLLVACTEYLFDIATVLILHLCYHTWNNDELCVNQLHSSISSHFLFLHPTAYAMWWTPFIQLF